MFCVLLQGRREANSEIWNENRWLKQKARKSPFALLLTNENLLLYQEQRKEVMVFRIKNDKNITAWSDKKDWILETICQIMQIQINLDFEDVVIKALEAKIMPKWYSWMGIHSQHWRKETGHKLWSYWTWDTHKERSETTMLLS